jgi:predicted nucleic acid-binding protein
MTVWLADASVLLAGQDPDDAEHAGAARLLAGPDSLSTLDLAFYEVTNVAVRAWRDQAAAARLCALIGAIARDGGLVRVDGALVTEAAAIAVSHDLSAYDAAYVAGARASGASLVSCDVGDLVSRGLAILPSEAAGGATPPAP